MEHRPHVVGSEAVDRIGVREQPNHVAVRHQNTLGATGRPRGVDDVGDVGGAKRANAIGVGHRCVRDRRQIDRVDVDERCADTRFDVRGQLDRVRSREENRCRTRIVEHVLDAVQRVARIDGEVTATGLHDRDQRDDEFRRPR